jgi:hypothetical protein
MLLPDRRIGCNCVQRLEVRRQQRAECDELSRQNRLVFEGHLSQLVPCCLLGHGGKGTPVSRLTSPGRARENLSDRVKGPTLGPCLKMGSHRRREAGADRMSMGWLASRPR